MEITMEKSIMMLMLSLRISASVWNHRSLPDNIWSVSYVPIRCSTVAFRDSDRMQLR